jgi:hypothetical protein
MVLSGCAAQGGGALTTFVCHYAADGHHHKDATTK